MNIGESSSYLADRQTSIDAADREDDYDAEVSSVIEYGTSSNGPLISWREWRDDAYLLQNKPNISIEQTTAMRRTDGQARALGNLITLPIRLALSQGRWIAPEGGDAEEEVEFANLMWNLPPALGGMTTPKTQLIPQILLAVFDGFAPFELVSHIPEIGPLKGMKVLRKMAYRDPKTVTLLQDSRGGYAGFRQQGYIPGTGFLDVSLSPGKTALFTVNGHENPLYGASYFESAYPHYEAKLKWYYISEQAGQYAAVPARMGTVPRNAKVGDVLAFKRSLEDMHFKSSMLMKEGYKVDSLPTTAGFDFMKYIDMHNMLMAKSVLAGFFESDQRTVLVENSTQDASADLFLLSMETMANELAEVLTNHVMPKYIRENFKDSTKFPVFKPGPLSENTRASISSLFEKVAISGILNVTPELVRELEKHVAGDLGLDVDYDDIENREQEAALQQSEQAEMLAEQAQMESIEDERAAEGGVPNSPVPTSANTTLEEAPSEAQLSMTTRTDYEEALDMLFHTAQNAFSNSGSINMPVDKGFDGE